MTKKILIINSSAFTIGDVAISKCMIEQISKAIPDAKITIESGNSLIHNKYLSNKKILIIQRLFDARKINYSKSFLSLSFIVNNFKMTLLAAS
ncbi:hypothetical protein COX23_03090 [Candidatus Gottesmanbacteria bacterium CG23_combo_of_CG06-09_8_20_14_all_37_19]|nr:MAG: hypothetical protein COX23_03090 [Candidatus Gottesmanbacteria bacterium CG23_combo_of_CG06-09_8_20_14_all_37_19]